MAMQDQSPPQPPVMTSEESNDRLMAALSYLFTPIAPVAVLAMDNTKNRPYPRYHAIQALGFFAAVVLFEILASVVFVCGSLITLGLASCVLWLLFFLPLIPAIYYAYLAYTGKPFVIPMLTNLMIKQGWLQRM